MIILSIETSCDETALALIEGNFSSGVHKFKVLGQSLNSQTELHAKYGGVFPIMAKRAHNENLIPLLKRLLEEAKLSTPASPATKSKFKEFYSNVLQNIGIELVREKELVEQFREFIPTIEKPPIDAIAVTIGPGLEPCLWTGINLAKALAFIWNLPIVPINHMEGHLVSVLLSANEVMRFPAIALLISGGHTELVLIKGWGDYKIIGRTRDDAVGEAFDKVARILGLPYPGGPQISNLAEEARNLNLSTDKFPLPRPMVHSKDLDFSFSGLKTAVLYAVRDIGALTEEIKKILALEFENAIVEVLEKKTRQALDEYSVKSLIVGGGVIANKTIRASLSKLADEYDIKFHIPTQALSTDNAIMIGIAGLINFNEGKTANPSTIVAQGNLSL